MIQNNHELALTRDRISYFPRSVIKWGSGQGSAVFLKPCGYTGAKPRGGKAGGEPVSNGLTVDTQGRLHLCEHGDWRVTRIGRDGKEDNPRRPLHGQAPQQPQ